MMRQLVSFSGGLDSTVLLASELSHGRNCIPVFFKYGSKQDELQEEAVKEICNYYSLSPQIVELPSVLVTNSGMALDSEEKPESVQSSTVPFRNMIFISILANIAQSNGIDRIVIGIQDGLNSNYKDCKPDFWYKLSELVMMQDDLIIDTPLMFLSKSGVLRKGSKLKVPFQLTRTCYGADQLACGVCPACIKRLEAFEFCDQDDPAQYKEQK